MKNVMIKFKKKKAKNPKMNDKLKEYFLFDN